MCTSVLLLSDRQVAYTGTEVKTDDSLVRAVRLARIPQYLRSSPGGLTTRELAKLCNLTLNSQLHKSVFTEQRDQGMAA